MTDAPSSAVILCPACTTPELPAVIAIKADAVEARCPSCKRRYRLLTRQVAVAHSQALSSGRVSYQLQTVEEEGRLRLRTFDAQPGLVLRAGIWVTLIWRGAQLVAIADQTNRMFNVVEPRPPAHPHVQRGVRVMLWGALLAGALQFARLPHAFTELCHRYSTGSVLAAGGALLLVCALPALMWALKAVRGSGEERRRLPSLPGLQ